MWWFEHKQKLRTSGLERRKYFTALSGDVSPERMRADVLQYLCAPTCDIFKEYLEGTLSWCCDRINATRIIVVD